MSFAVTTPLPDISATTPMAAPAEPRAVIGTAMASGELKPNSGLMRKASFSPIIGRIAIPWLASPV